MAVGTILSKISAIASCNSSSIRPCLGLTLKFCNFATLRPRVSRWHRQASISVSSSLSGSFSRPGHYPRASYSSGRRSPSMSAAMADTQPARLQVETQPAKMQVLLPIANGSEEMEIVIIADILRRAGADVTLASVGEELLVPGSRNIKLVADTLISSCEGRRYDLIVLPGGMPGATYLRDSLVLKNLTRIQAEENRLYAAICVAPALVLEPWGLLNGLKATGHPSFTDKLSKFEAGSKVVTDGSLITSQGPGTTIEFALCLVEQLYGKGKRKEISTPLVFQSDGPLKSFVKEFNPQEWKFNAPGKCFQILMPIANGSEDMEIVIIVDVLRRAGYRVIMASIEKELQILASRNVKIVADQFLHDVPPANFDMIILPGGMPGAERLRDCELLTKLLAKQLEMKKPIGAICAAPAVVFEAKGLLKGKKATAHPAFSSKLSDQSAVDARVVIDGLTVTSRGPGTAMEFALSIVEKVSGQGRSHRMAGGLVVPYA